LNCAISIIAKHAVAQSHLSKIQFLPDKLNYVSSSIITQSSKKSSRGERQLLHSPQLLYRHVKITITSM
jgi:hypothetical protein